MDEHDKRRVGEEIEPGGRRKAPGRLELLQRFVNSHNHDLPDDWDRIGTAEKAQDWLRSKRLVEAGERVSDADAAYLRDLREAIRALALANHGGSPPAAATELVRRAARDAHLVVAVDDSGRTALAPAGRGTDVVGVDDTGRTTLEPAGRGVDAVVATLLGILHEAQLTGDWPRLKGCRQCGYAFFDRSKNRSATWCAMSICGNRAKNRTYYRRRAT